jgi:FtsH-binding integral membrane protein
MITQKTNRFMGKVYSLMGLGLAVSSLFAYLVYESPYLQRLIFGNLLLLIGLVVIEIGLVFVISGMIEVLSPNKAKFLFFVYSALTGLTISSILFVYTFESLFVVFLITAGMFYGLSFYSRVTKRDLSGWGKFLFMALVGLIISLVINMFFQSVVFDLVIGFVGVLIFSALVAYDNQMLIKMSQNIQDRETLEKISVRGALRLYLDVVNLFLSLLRLLGDRR